MILLNLKDVLFVYITQRYEININNNIVLMAYAQYSFQTVQVVEI